MTQANIIEIVSAAILVAIKIASPILIAIMLTGIVVSIIQAATQINEQTLSFIPKILAMTIAVVVAGPWILKTILFFTNELLSNIPKVTY